MLYEPLRGKKRRFQREEFESAFSRSVSFPHPQKSPGLPPGSTGGSGGAYSVGWRVGSAGGGRVGIVTVGVGDAGGIVTFGEGEAVGVFVGASVGYRRDHASVAPVEAIAGHAAPHGHEEGAEDTQY